MRLRLCVTFMIILAFQSWAINRQGNPISSGNGNYFDSNNDGLIDIYFDTGGNAGIGTVSPASTLEVQGTTGYQFQSVTGDVTLSGNSYIFADAEQAGGNITITLPTASTYTGRQYFVKKTSSGNTVMLSGNIDGETSANLIQSAVGYPYIHLMSDGSVWRVLDKTVNNSAPVISTISDKSTVRNNTINFIVYTVNEGVDNEEYWQTLSVNAVFSDNTNLVANSNIINSFGDNGISGNGEMSITPTANMAGNAMITLSMTDGTLYSSTTFQLTVAANVSEPTAYPVNASTGANVAVNFTLVAADLIAGDAITGYTIDTNPNNGTITGVAPNLTYTPNTHFTGNDQLTYYATDAGGEQSNLAIVTFLIGGNVLFVVDTGTAGRTSDAQVEAVFTELGFNYTVVDDDADDASVAPNYDLIMVSASCSSTKVDDNFKTVAQPVITWESALYDNADFAFANTSNRENSQTQIQITNANHPLAGGLSAGNHTVYNVTAAMAWGQPTSDAEIVATLASDNTRAVLFVYELGDTLDDGSTATGKRVGYFLPDNGSGELNSTGNTVLKAAINEALAR